MQRTRAPGGSIAAIRADSPFREDRKRRVWGKENDRRSVYKSKLTCRLLVEVNSANGGPTRRISPRAVAASAHPGPRRGDFGVNPAQGFRPLEGAVSWDFGAPSVGMPNPVRPGCPHCDQAGTPEPLERPPNAFRSIESAENTVGIAGCQAGSIYYAQAGPPGNAPATGEAGAARNRGSKVDHHPN